MGDRARPWSKFYWSDWESDNALRQCSLAAQGLWMRMLCICAKGEPHGYLTIAGVPLDVAAIATAVSKLETEIGPLVEELERWGVFSRDRKGRIYSRRMIRDERKSNEGRKAKKEALKGMPQVTENVDKNHAPSRGATRVPSPHMPEAREEPTKEATASLGADSANEHEGPTERDLVWKGGLQWLIKQTGMPEKPAREMVGKWCKGGNEALLLSVLRDCRDHQPPIFDVIPWIVATLEERKTRNVRQTQNQHRPAARAYGEDADTRRRAILKSLAGDMGAGGAAA